MRTHTLWLLLSALAIPHCYAQDDTELGCYEMEDYFTFNNVYEWQSRGECIKKCVALEAPLAAMSGGNECYCSDTMPNTKVDRKKCDKTCNGYKFELCMFSPICKRLLVLHGH